MRVPGIPDKLTMQELGALVWKKGEDAVSLQDILDEAARRYKNETIPLWQFRNLMATMADRDKLQFPAKLTHDTPEVRAYLFEKLRNKLTSASSTFDFRIN